MPDTIFFNRVFSNFELASDLELDCMVSFEFKTLKIMKYNADLSYAKTVVISKKAPFKLDCIKVNLYEYVNSTCENSNWYTRFFKETDEIVLATLYYYVKQNQEKYITFAFLANKENLERCLKIKTVADSNFFTIGIV